MNQFTLTGPEIFITKDPACSYLVVSGKLLVYAVPLVRGEPWRRTLLAEVTEKQCVPAMYLRNKEYGEWAFLFAAVDTAVVAEYSKQPDGLITSFAAQIKLNLMDEESFAEEVIEKVNLRLITEEGYIYAVSEEQKNTYDKGLSLIYNLFHKKRRAAAADNTGSLLYDSLAYLCAHEDIAIAPFENIKEACGRRFTLEDIARLSHFICREVILDENWFRQDSGSLMVFSADSNAPMVCLQAGAGKYTLYNNKTKTSQRVTQEVAQEIAPKAYMIYRPLKNKAIGIKELAEFGLKSIRKTDILNILLFSLIGALIALLLPYLNEKIFDSYIPLGNSGTLVETCALILAFTVGNLSFTIVKNLAVFRSTNSMEIGVQSAVFDRLYNMPISFYGKYESADLANRALGISAIYKLLSEVAITTILTAVFSLLYLFRMFKYSNKLTWIGILLIVVNMLVTLCLGWLQLRHEKKLAEQKSKVSSIMYQLLGGIAKIRIAGVENRALLQYLEPYVEMKKVYVKNERLSNLANNINLFLGTVFSSVFYYMMISKSLEISFGEFVGFTSAFGSFAAAMVAVVSAFLQVNSAIPTYERAKDILETPQEYEEDSIVVGRLSGKIEVNNLHFRYSAESEMVLKDLSFCIEPGQYVGIVGSSGSGKSTLLKVLLGFEKPTMGKVYYDDKDIDSLDKRELRKRFGVVLQDGQLITGSIYENVTITGGQVANKQVEQVIRDVGMERDIAAMPMGLHTVVSEGGGTISGGQRQRLLIARAIVNRPNILFFDEATSALDNVNQALVCESLEKLRATRVVVAHRLSTVMNCDRILVFENGQLIEDGSYAALMRQKGRFYDLAVRQLA